MSAGRRENSLNAEAAERDMEDAHTGEAKTQNTEAQGSGGAASLPVLLAPLSCLYCTPNTSVPPSHQIDHRPHSQKHQSRRKAGQQPTQAGASAPAHAAWPGASSAAHERLKHVVRLGPASGAAQHGAKCVGVLVRGQRRVAAPRAVALGQPRLQGVGRRQAGRGRPVAGGLDDQPRQLPGGVPTEVWGGGTVGRGWGLPGGCRAGPRGRRDEGTARRSRGKAKHSTACLS